jgi:2-polyprenyl-3-methyl-5-hydroxy-6-metoxy-1,4-benzoquinol methylase
MRTYVTHSYPSHHGELFECLRGAEYVLCECAECALLYQREAPNGPLQDRLYEQWRGPDAAWTQHDDLGFYSRGAQEMMQVIAFFRTKPSALTFLDFGMGWGSWVLMAKAFGCECYGTELSDRLIQHARSNGIKVVDWQEILRYRFDLINTEQVFEHLSDPVEVLQHLRKCLKPAGLLKISVPTAFDIKRRLRRANWSAPKGSLNSLNPVAPLEHINLFRRRSLATMAQKAGMEIVSMPLKLHYRFVTDWAGPTRTAKNIILPLYRRTIQNHVFLRNA